jgi:hypothetical protein
MKFILLFPDRILQLVRTMAHYIGNLEFSTVAMLEFGIAVVALGLWLFVFAGHINFSKKAKRIALITLAVVFVALSVVNMTPRDTVMEVYIPETYGDEMFVLATDDDNGAYVFSNSLIPNEVALIVKYLQLKNIDNLYIFSTETYILNDKGLATLHEMYGITKIYSLDGSDNDEAEKLLGSDYIYFIPPNQPSFTPIAVTPIVSYGIIGLAIDTGQFSVGVSIATFEQSAERLEEATRGKVDIMYDNFFPEIHTGTVVTRTVHREANIYSITKHGAFTFHTKSDTIDIKR